MNSEFKNYHPVVIFSYFTSVIIFTMIFMHPICLLISFCTGFAHSVIIGGKKSVRFNIMYIIPLAVITAVLNPMFNHRGVTILFYLPGGNPFTLESTIYGIAAAVMLSSVIWHFSCLNKIMTEDKIIYLFGKTVPSLSLIISMVFRFVPKFREQIKIVEKAQKGVGRDMETGGLINKIKNGTKILSVMITWSLENAIDTADSMKSRGYGLSGRTAYHNFIFGERDLYVLLSILMLSGYIVSGYICGGLDFKYFPSISGIISSDLTLSILVAYLILCMIPIIIEIREVLMWKKLKSKI